MRILYFNYLWDIKGASLGSAIKPIELFAALEKLGHPIKICWMRKQPDYGNLGGQRIHVRELLKRYFARFVHDPKLFLENILYAKHEQELVLDFKPDLIVSRLDFYLFSAIKTAQKFGLPIIIEADSPPIFEAIEFQKQYWHAAWIASRIERWVLLHADFVIMQSQVLQQHFIRKHGLKKTAVISNGADSEKFAHSAKQQALSEKYDIQDALVLGFVGSMSIWHGVEHLLNLMRQIAIRHSKVKFMFVGAGGTMEPVLKELARQENLKNNIILTGYVPYNQIPVYINLMDIVLAPYPNLPFFYYSPVKIFEYMAAGKAVVSSKIGQIAEIITSEQDGILCEPDDFAGMMSAVERLLHDTDRRRQLGLNARHTIAQKHTWLHKARQWERICRQVLIRE